jgi:nucleoid-associated protein YgaU
MTYNQFAAAWGSCHEFQNNPDFVGLITENALPDVEVPQPNPVKQKEINRIMAWATFMGLTVDESKLTNRQVADVYLDFVGPWGSKVVDHTVQQGDDLGLIALRYYADPLKWKVIVYYNDLPPIDAIHVGDVLKIPEPVVPV